MCEDARDLELLRPFEAEFEEAHVCVLVVCCGHDSDEDGTADIGVHAVCFGDGAEVWFIVTVIFYRGAGLVAWREAG